MTPASKRGAARGGALFLGLALILGLTSTDVRADDWNLKTSFSVEQPIEVPGAVLEPHTKYIIQLMELPASRNVLRISNEDETEVITTFHTVDDRRRQELVEEPTFDFMEVPAGNPVPVRAWYYPGRITGFEFLYPDDQKDKIAAYRTTTKSAEIDLALAKPSAQDELPTEVTEESQLTPPPETEPELALVQEQVSQVETPQNEGDANLESQEAIATPEQSEVTEDTSTTTMPEALPKTAGELPLVGLLGALSLCLGLTVRFATK
jgi:hypothetical protein